jgi:hypothetical protein
VDQRPNTVKHIITPGDQPAKCLASVVMYRVLRPPSSIVRQLSKIIKNGGISLKLRDALIKLGQLIRGCAGQIQQARPEWNSNAALQFLPNVGCPLRIRISMQSGI